MTSEKLKRFLEAWNAGMSKSDIYGRFSIVAGQQAKAAREVAERFGLRYVERAFYDRPTMGISGESKLGLYDEPALQPAIIYDAQNRPIAVMDPITRARRPLGHGAQTETGARNTFQARA